jgi:hypothetical protein
MLSVANKPIAECHFAECRYAKCRGAKKNIDKSVTVFTAPWYSAQLSVE